MTAPHSLSFSERGRRVTRILAGSRLLWLSLLFAGLSLTGLYVIYDQVADQNLRWDMRLLAPEALAGAAALLLAYFAADGLRLWFTLRALGQRIPLSAVARLVFLNIFVSNITPLATGGGVAQVWFLQRRGVAVGTALTATTIRTMLAVLFIFGATPVLLVTLPEAEQATREASLMTTLVVCVTLYLGFFALVLFAPRALLRPLLAVLGGARRLHLLAEPRRRRWRRRLVRELYRFAAGFRTYITGPINHILGSLLCTALFLLTLFSFPALILYALGYEPDYWLVIGRLVMTTFVMYFSPTPGASGIAEGVFGYFFSDLLNAAHLVLVTVVWRGLTIYLGMLIGIFVTHHEVSRSVPERQP